MTALAHLPVATALVRTIQRSGKRVPWWHRLRWWLWPPRPLQPDPIGILLELPAPAIGEGVIDGWVRSSDDKVIAVRSETRYVGTIERRPPSAPRSLPSDGTPVQR